MAPESPKPHAWAKISHPQSGIAATSNVVDVRPLIFVAHPDDETIGASVALSRMRSPTVVFLTDGAPQDARFWSPDAKGTREAYSQLRTQEAIAALELANVPRQRMLYLDAVDQDAIENVPALVQTLVTIVNRTQPDVIITHPYEGGHPDHDAAALIAQLAVHSPEVQRKPEILEMASYHLRDGACLSGEFLQGTGGEELLLWLSPEERSRKQRMVASHHSQRFVLEGFRLEPERIRPAPAYDFTQPPHAGKLWYECLGWRMTGVRWRQLAAAAVTQLRHNT